MYHLKDSKVTNVALFIARHCVYEIGEIHHELFFQAANNDIKLFKEQYPE